ncbi:MAG: MMPL family transporter, partial [Actinomycetota bacterium]|nr:MMPL family transporter [Actinomycetota bacterium]
MIRISQWAVRHPIMGLVSWFAIIGILIALLTQFKGDFNDDFGLPSSESTTAQELLKDISGGGAGTGSGLEGQVVWRTDSGKATEGAAAASIGAALKEISTLPGVGCVISPLSAAMGPDCLPQQAPAAPTQEQAAQIAQLPAEALGPLAHFGQAGVSPSGNIAYATVQFQGSDMSDLPTERIADALNVVKAIDEEGLTVGANGMFTFVQGEPPSSEGIGILVALTILMFAFASILGAFLPVWVAAISVGISTAVVVPIIANFFSVAAFAPFLSSMIGLGVGIDYALFIINRYREALLHGREPREAALEAVRTSGRAVLFAALTVIIALLGLFIMGISFFNGVALAAAGTVVLVAIGALLLL